MQSRLRTKLRLTPLLLLIAATLCMPGTAMAAKGSSGKTTISRSYISQSGHYGVIPANNAKKCGTSAYWGFDATTPGGKAMMAKLEAAIARGRKVDLKCNGAIRTTWNRIVAVIVY